MATVLLVEDDSAVLKVLRQILQKHGYNILEAGGAAEALALASRFDQRIDLLITDVVLPHTSASRLVEELKHVRPELRVIYISGYSEDMLARYGVAGSEPNFLPKPFSAETLARKVRDVLAGSARVQRAGQG